MELEGSRQAKEIDNNPKVSREAVVAQKLLDEDIGQYIQTSIRLTKSLPPQVLEHEERRLLATERKISYLSAYCGDQKPEVLVANRIRTILTNFTSGIYHTGETYGSLNRSDSGVLKMILSDLRLRDKPFGEGGDEEQLRFLAEVQRVNEIEDVERKFHYNGNWFPSGSTVVIENGITDDSLSTPSLSIPLLPGREYVLAVNECHNNTFPCFIEEAGRDAIGEITTFPVSNAIFYYETVNGSIEKRIVKLPTETDISNEHLGSYSENVLDATRISEGTEITPAIRKDLLDIFMKGMKIGKKRLQQLETEELLEKIMDFISESNSGEAISEGDMDLDVLLEHYKETGEFPGTCKSVATVTAGACRAFGLPARVLEGQIVHKSGGINARHMWSEVYVPKMEKWLPVDPALGAFLTYPQKDEIYILNGNIFSPQGRSVKLNVMWGDQDKNQAIASE